MPAEPGAVPGPASGAPAAAAAVPSAAWPTAFLAVGLALAKIVPWGLPEAGWGPLADYLTDLAVITHRDLLFALATGATFQLAHWLARRRPAVQRALRRVLLAWGAACVAYAAVSVYTFAYLRSPLTYPLLYLAGDLSSMRSSLGAVVDGWLLAGLVLGPLAYLAACWGAARLRPPAVGGRARWLAPAGLALLLLELGWAGVTHAGAWSDRADHLVAQSPHAAFLASCAQEALGLHARALDEPFAPQDLEEFELPVRRPAAGRRPLPGRAPRNVILLVLETTGTRYLQVYGSRYATTPSLVAESRHLLAFDDFYSHVGLTANAMAAITLSLYPYMTWREYTVEYPRLPGRTLAQVLKAKGRRTGFFHTGDLEYVNQRGFLEGRGFDVIRDFRDLGGQDRLSSWGGEDRQLVDGLLRWVDEARGQPFFAMGWTIQSHHPYEPSPDRPLVDFFGKDLPPDDYDLGRYLNTLLEVDRQLGRLFEGLRARKLADDTLVVITGDHGEAFGSPHPTWGHGAKLYDEGLKVPLLVWSPRLVRQGRHLRTIGSHVDLNPTVTDLLGLPADDSWHGRSMFDPGRPPRAYFYATNNDYLLGVREGDFKYVYNLTAGKEELYDLAADPDEQRNVAAQHPVKCQRLRQRVAAWRAHEAQHMAALKAAMPEETAEPPLAAEAGPDR